MEIDLEKIGDRAVQDAVGDVARGSAEEKGEAYCVHGAGISAGDKKPGDEGDDDKRTGDKNDAQGGRREASKKTEGDSGVARVDKVEAILNDGVWKMSGWTGFDPGFVGAVEEDDGQGEPEET